MGYSVVLRSENYFLVIVFLLTAGSIGINICHGFFKSWHFSQINNTKIKISPWTDYCVIAVAMLSM